MHPPPHPASARPTDLPAAGTGALQLRLRRLADRVAASPWASGLCLALLSLAPSVAIILALGSDWMALARYWDGPNYIEVAKTLYHVPADHPLRGYGTTPAYFACHLPLYPLLVRALAVFMDYPQAMIAATMATAVAATLAFHRLLCEFGCVRHPLLTAAASTVLPARWLVYKTVGATEPLFLLTVCLSLLAWRRGRVGWACAIAGLAGITRIVGILFVVVYALDALRLRAPRRLLWLPLCVLPLFATFCLYAALYGDFWAYFSWNAGLIDLRPFEYFRRAAAAGNAHSAEFYLALYVLNGLGVLLLWPQRTLFFYALVFFGFNLFVLHEDASRYLLTVAPFTLLVAYDRVLATRAFVLALPIAAVLSVAYAAGMVRHNQLDRPAFERLLAQPAWP